MQNKRSPLALFSLFLLAFSFSLLPSSFAVDPDAELGPGVAQKVNQQDAPLDHAVTKDASQQGIRQTGAGDPVNKLEPIKDQWFQSGKFPRDTYTYNVGKDGKIYGKGQKPPKGSNQQIAIRLTQYENGWVANAEIVHKEGDDYVTDGIANSGMGANDRLSSDQTSDVTATMDRNADRMNKFKAKDPVTAVRQALVKLQMKGKLYDPSKEIEETQKREEEAQKAALAKKETPAAAVPSQNHTYMRGGSHNPRFKITENKSPLPASATVSHYDYFPRYNAVPQTVVGPPPAATDSPATYPSEPWDSFDKEMPGNSLYRYSGDHWGDCLGPSCVDRGGFRPPVGRWVQFTSMRTERRDDLRGFIGFFDTIDALSQRLGPVIELKNDQQ